MKIKFLNHYLNLPIAILAAIETLMIIAAPMVVELLLRGLRPKTDRGWSTVPAEGSDVRVRRRRRAHRDGALQLAAARTHAGPAAARVRRAPARAWLRRHRFVLRAAAASGAGPVVRLGRAVVPLHQRDPRRRRRVARRGRVQTPRARVWRGSARAQPAAVAPPRRSTRLPCGRLHAGAGRRNAGGAGRGAAAGRRHELRAARQGTQRRRDRDRHGRPPARISGARTARLPAERHRGHRSREFPRARNRAACISTC